MDLPDEFVQDPLAEMEEKIKELENEKKSLIEEIKRLSERLKYKKLERQALIPFLEQTKDVDVSHLKRKLKRLEFKISTQAYTLKIERQMIKKVKEIEAELTKYEPVERARRKEKLIKKDIEKINEKIRKKEEKLKNIRAELKKLYMERKRQKSLGDHTVTLADVAIIEKSSKE
jgi:uncharacterized coiled-coil DUF342 family protein